jgi:ribonucleoside-triphosphate reductase
MQVIKRDGTTQEFDSNKIKTAILKAFDACCPSELPEDLDGIIADMNFWDGIEIEDIQDIVIETLQDYGYDEVATAYASYRNKQSMLRYIEGRIDYMNEYMSSGNNAASSSETDANANVTVKNVANLESENSKMLNRDIQRYRMKKQLKKQFPEVASQYEKDLENHIIYTHDEASSPVVKNYCEAVTLYPLLLEGTKGLDNLNVTPPQNLTSFCGQFINMVFLLSAQCKGAVGLAEFFNFFDYFCVKEWGPEYHLKENVFIDSEHCLHRKTLGQQIEQHFQNVVYNLNQSAGNRGNQSPFTNFNYFDSNYWQALFGDFYFPDGTQPSWERVSYLQKKFMKWFNKERLKTVLTFPVESMLLLTDGKDVLDKEYKEFTAEMYAEGHSFFTYLSSNPNAVASCCRLRNELTDNTFMKTIGLAGVQTGSCNVITLNLNRIVQDWDRQHGNKKDIESFKLYLKDILDRVYKYHIAFKTLLYEVEKLGMFTSSNAGFIKMSKLFSTVSINGHNEMCEYLGYTVSNNEDYINFISDILSFIETQNKLNSKPGFIMNLECAPKSVGA